ncbi:hypothetical protein [Streptomyces sp. NPDC101776]|uniref:hypothetical protein n=1 Tax=Streptomyces sp. NPDC101776 TaxID=3366146 RepID=UPI003807202B
MTTATGPPPGIELRRSTELARSPGRPGKAPRADKWHSAATAGGTRDPQSPCFATKEDVLLVMVEDHSWHTRDALAGRPDDEPVWTALRYAPEPAVRQEGKDTAAALQTARAIVRSPSVRSYYQER